MLLTSCQSSLAYLGPAGQESEDQDSISELSRWKSSQRSGGQSDLPV